MQFDYSTPVTAIGLFFSNGSCMRLSQIKCTLDCCRLSFRCCVTPSDPAQLPALELGTVNQRSLLLKPDRESTAY